MSSLQIDIDGDSWKVAEDVKAGLEAAFDYYDIHVPDDENEGLADANIKIQKFAYRVIEHFDLPVIRTWYRYGQFEPYGTLRPERVSQGTLNSPQKVVPSNSYDNLTRKEIRGFFIEQDDLAGEWEQPLFEFLKHNYESEASDTYERPYLQNLEIMRVLEEMVADENLAENAGEYADQIKSPSIDIRHELSTTDQFGQDEINLVQEFLDDLQMALVTLAAQDEPSGAQISTVRKARNVYHEDVWPWPAMQISIDQAKGPRKELSNEFLPEGREYLEIFESTFPQKLNGWQSRVRKADLVSGPTVYQRVKGSMSSSVGSLEQAALGQHRHEQ